MIIPTFRCETLGGLFDIHESQFAFLPCGSRFFGDAKKDSDYDFFIQHGNGVELFLIEKGFIEKSTDCYDCNSVQIFNKGEVTVITVFSEHDRLKVQSHIINNSIRRPKGDTEFWNSLYRDVCGIGK